MLAPNDILRDRYRIISLLGQGGMGAVYEAMDSVFDSTVALKEIVIDLSNVNNTKAEEMVHAAFEREAKLLAKINHETFPHVKDYFSYDNRQFLVMELVDGDDLSNLLKDRGAPFPVSDVVNWADQLLDGLDYLHTQTPPIIHRDLKPQNLKLNSRGKIKLLDFGIAKGTDSANPTTITDQTFVAATLNYSPIEQMIRVIDPTFLAVITHKYSEQVEPLLEQNADTRSDIYALGATLYNLLTAVSPVEAVKRGVDVWDGKLDPLQNPSSINPTIPEDLSEWLLKSMQIRREHRFSSAGEMRDTLKHINSTAVKQSAQKTEVMNFPIPSAAEVPRHTEADVNDVNSVRTIAAPKNVFPTGTSQPNVVNTGGPAVNTAQPVVANNRSYKILWLIPVFAFLFLVVGVGGFGAWWFLRDRGTITDSNSNVNSDPPILVDLSNVNTEPTPEVEDTPGISMTDVGSGDSTPETPRLTQDTSTPKATPNVRTSTPRPSTPRPTPRPTVSRPTPRPTVQRTPPRPTPQPTKKKIDKCIFTDDC